MENRYNKIKFEVVTGVSDYASKIQFQNNFVCKIKIGNRYSFFKQQIKSLFKGLC